MRLRTPLTIGLVLLTVSVCWSAAGLLSVQVRNAQLRASPSFLAPPSAPLSVGETVEVLQQQGDWLEVRSAKQARGWIHQSALSTKRVTVSAGDQNAPLKATGSELALAGKGFNAEVEARYRASHTDADYLWVDKMETFAISSQEMNGFLKAGGLQATGGRAR